MGVSKEQVESALRSKLTPSHILRCSEKNKYMCLFENKAILHFLKTLMVNRQNERAMADNWMFYFREVIDTSGGCGASFKVEIVSDQFEGKKLLERHRMVNGALAEEMKDIHALSITKALTPDQWKKKQESGTSPLAA